MNLHWLKFKKPHSILESLEIDADQSFSAFYFLNPANCTFRQPVPTMTETNSTIFWTNYLYLYIHSVIKAFDYDTCKYLQHCSNTTDNNFYCHNCKTRREEINLSPEKKCYKNSNLLAGSPWGPFID